MITYQICTECRNGVRCKGGEKKMDTKKENREKKERFDIENDGVRYESGEELDTRALEAALHSVDVEDVDSDKHSRERRKLSREEVTATLKKVALGALWLLCAAMLGTAKLPFGAMPLGIALLCAASSKLAYIYAGLCVSSVFSALSGEGGLVFFCAYTATVLIRIICRIVIDNPFHEQSKSEDSNSALPSTLGEIMPMMFSEHILLRMANSCIGAFIIGIYTLAKGGFLFYDLWGAVVGMIAAPVAVYLYCGLSGEGGALGSRCEGMSAHVSEERMFAAVVALSASLILSAREIGIFGVSPSLFFAMALTLFYSRRKGIMHSLSIGTVCGLAASPMLAPAFAFAAIGSGALWKVSTFFACLAACTSALAWSLYSEGIAALSTVLPAILSASLGFAVVEKVFLSDYFDRAAEAYEKKTDKTSVENIEEKKCELLGTDTLSTVVLDDTEQRIKVMCETFSSLSSLFYSLSEKMRTPTVSDLKQICDNAFDNCCHGCEMRETCWESEYSTSLSAVGRICSVLGKNGHVTLDDVPEELLSRCAPMPDIIDQINRNGAIHTQQLIIGDKTEIFALDYEAISNLLATTMAEQREEFEYREELSRKAIEIINEKKIAVDSLFAYGNDRTQSFLLRSSDKRELAAKKEELTAILEELSAVKLNCEIGDEGEAKFTSARRYSVEFAKRSVKAEGEEGFCGDTVNIFENEKDCFYSFISDGMGSGRDAALTSGICSVFLSRVLRARNKCDISLNMLNGFLRNKGSGSMHECSATVDLLELDLITGKAEFYKGGAAPSYILRDGGLFKLRSNTVPLGIIKELDAKKISIDVSVGDIIIMVSDGVTQSKEECPWLFDLLKQYAERESLASIADMIVKRAKYEGASDDITVVVMKVRENS